VQFCFNWDHVSAIAGLHRTGFCFRLYDGSVNQERIVEFLNALKRHLRGPLLILWDGAKTHRSRMVRDYVDSTRGQIVIERTTMMSGHSPAFLIYGGLLVVYYLICSVLTAGTRWLEARIANRTQRLPSARAGVPEARPQESV